MVAMVRKVLQAGVGAFALTKDEVEDFVSKLVERGEIAEQDGRERRAWHLGASARSFGSLAGCGQLERPNAKARALDAVRGVRPFAPLEAGVEQA